MTIEVIRYSGGGQAPVAEVLSFDVLRLDAFLEEHAKSRSSVFVLPVEALNRLRAPSASGGLLIDRGTQHDTKGLSRYVAKDGQPIALCTKYDTPRRLLRGIGSVLERFADSSREPGRKVMFLGVPAELFHKLGRPRVAAARASSADSALNVYDDLLYGVEVAKPIEESFLGQSLQSRVVRKLIQVVASDDGFDPVLLVGESGMGKSLAARLIHAQSSRSNGPFKDVNCAAIPTELFEFELFGSRTDVFGGGRGSSRGRGDEIADKVGYWEAAENGTLFLDEIGDLRLDHQAKVLLALETRKIRRVGRNRDVPVNARVIAATNQNLLEAVANGTFREDLLNRLQLMTISFPSFRENSEDIPLLVEGLWTRLCGPDVIELPQDALDAFIRWTWPGGVREIKNLLRQAHLLIRMARRSDPKKRLTLRIFEAIRAEGVRGERRIGRSSVQRTIEALRLLARAESVLAACDAGLRSLFARRAQDADERARAPNLLRAHLCDVALVARSAQDALDDRPAEALASVRERLAQLDREATVAWPEARALWKAKVAPAILRTSAAIREEIVRVACQL